MVAGQSRRSFLKGTSLGVAVVGAALTPGVFRAPTASAEAPSGPMSAGPVVAYVRDPASGEIAVLAGEREVVVHDAQLAARLARIAAGAAGSPG